MIGFNTWNKTNNIVYIIGLIMLEQIGLLYNLYEGHDVHIQKKKYDTNVYHSLFNRFVKGAIKYRQSINFRCDDFATSVIPRDHQFILVC